ncbi:MAG: hypothetical protein H8F28_13130, partial [Fibrella sp.]|nr:hypothetical protein [Armatimonadota bacterium]
LACLEANGFDPIDVADYSHTLGTSPDVGFFATEGLWDELTTFRWKQNKDKMARIHNTLKTTAPKLPVYLNDRASSYAYTNSSWYVRWVQPERIAVCPLYTNVSTHREAAFSVSPEALLNRWGRNGKASDFANAVAETVENSRKWSGIVVDCASLTPADVLRMLGGIADSVK